MARQKKERKAPQSNTRLLSAELIDSIVTTPITFISPRTCNQAWFSWYGSMEAVSAIRNEIIDSGVRLDGFTRSDLKQMEDGTLLSTVLLDRDRRAALQEVIGDKRVLELMPQASLFEKTSTIIGAGVFDNLQKKILSSSSVELLAMAQAALPQLGDVIEVGGFSHELITAGVMLRAVLDVNEDQSPLSSEWNLPFCWDMVVHLYLQMIPVDAVRRCIILDYPRLEALYPAADELDELFDQRSPVFGSYVDWGASLSFALAAQTIDHRSRRNKDPVDSMLETLQSFMLATSPVSRFTEFAIMNVVLDANLGWEALLDTLKILNVDTEVLNASGIDLEAELIPSNLPSSAYMNSLVVDRARMVRCQIQPMLENQSYYEQAIDLSGCLAEVNSEISKIATDGKGNYELLGNLSKKGAELSLRRDQLISDVLSMASAVMNVTKTFIEVIKPADAPPLANAHASTDVQHVASDSANDAVVVSENSDLEAELLAINTQLESDLKAAQVENYRLTSANNALQARLESPTGTVDRDFQDLTRRKTQGLRLNPEELLRFYNHLASDRMVVLDSAWKSSRQSVNFAYPERLDEQLRKLVFDFLDQVREGTSMGLAGRELFAGVFAAKESQTVSQDHSMRAQREFSYHGETRFFEYRLRTGNGWGTVEGMRLYFDVIDGKVVIAYVGPHLDQPSTN